eukprot:m.259593 g.259593  ORF g.259593 m.259593 type:complete len:241 (-) comp22652_c0_seq1:28-750(-)
MLYANNLHQIILILFATLLLCVALTRIGIASKLEHQRFDGTLGNVDGNGNNIPGQPNLYTSSTIFSMWSNIFSLLSAVVVATAMILTFLHVYWWTEASRYGALAINFVALALDALAAGYAINYLQSDKDFLDRSRLADALAGLTLADFALQMIMPILLSQLVDRQLIFVPLVAVPAPAPAVRERAAESYVEDPSQPVEYCTFCSAKLSPGDAFCRACGNNRSVPLQRNQGTAGRTYSTSR